MQSKAREDIEIGPAKVSTPPHTIVDVRNEAASQNSSLVIASGKVAKAQTSSSEGLLACYQRHQEKKKKKRVQKDSPAIKSSELSDSSTIQRVTSTFELTAEEVEGYLERSSHGHVQMNILDSLITKKVLPYIAAFGEGDLADKLIHKYGNYKTAMAIFEGDEADRRDAILYMLHQYQSSQDDYDSGSLSIFNRKSKGNASINECSNSQIEP